MDTTQEGRAMSAPTAVALLAKLDALVKPEPEVWRWRCETGAIVGKYRSAQHARGCMADRGTPVRETVDPITGVVTLTPECV